jgi:hypothetical protein
MAKAVKWNILEIQKPVYRGSYLDLELFILDKKFELYQVAQSLYCPFYDSDVSKPNNQKIIRPIPQKSYSNESNHRLVYHEANIEGGGKTVHVVFIICLEVCCGKGGGG